MNNFDAWLSYNSETENREAAEDTIEDFAKHLKNNNPDYDHRLFENFIEDINSASVEQAKSIEEYLQMKDFEKLGRLLYCISLESREKFAYLEAERAWQDGEL
jgi:uncharacterized protein YfdQ (DUF2303 family)